MAKLAKKASTVVKRIRAAKAPEGGCQACNGTGLKDANNLCPNCKGSGKI